MVAFNDTLSKEKVPFLPMKKLLLFLLLAPALHSTAQMDLLVLKNKNRTLQTWIKGSEINFQFSSKQWIRGYIKDIRNDSLLVDMFTVRSVYTELGVFRLDTGRMGMLKLHIKEIYAVPNRTHTNLFNSGALFKIAGASIISANIFNSLIRKEQVFSSRNLTTIGIAGGVFAIGTLLSSVHKTSVVLGGRYTLRILSGGKESIEQMNKEYRILK
jgi:hypothetical protein